MCIFVSECILFKWLLFWIWILKKFEERWKGVLGEEGDSLIYFLFIFFLSKYDSVFIWFWVNIVNLWIYG